VNLNYCCLRIQTRTASPDIKITKIPSLFHREVNYATNFRIMYKKIFFLYFFNFPLTSTNKLFTKKSINYLHNKSTINDSVCWLSNKKFKILLIYKFVKVARALHFAWCCQVVVQLVNRLLKVLVFWSFSTPCPSLCQSKARIFVCWCKRPVDALAHSQCPMIPVQ
jgi:hypothetical protein